MTEFEAAKTASRIKFIALNTFIRKKTIKNK